MSKSHKIWKVLAAGGLLAVLFPAQSFASRPEIDCNSLPEADVQKFYELSGQVADISDSDVNKAIQIAEQAMAMCTSDYYTEYTLARLYHKNDDCPNAYYHYEILDSRPESVKKENADLVKNVKKYFKEIKNECRDVVTLEIQCAQPDTQLTITGLPVENLKCPFYGKVLPNSYQVTVSKEGYQTRKEMKTVPASGAVWELDPLKESVSQGYIRVLCPRGASKFVLQSEDGKTDEYVCPWEGPVPTGNYKIYLGGAKPDTATSLIVTKDGRTEHVIPSSMSTNCSAQPMQSHEAPLAALMAALGAFGVGMFRRRQTAKK